MSKLACPGFRFAGVAAGIKASGDRDVGLIVADAPCATSAVFTRNKVAAAPVLLSQRALRASGGQARAIVVNAGNANACTGPDGVRDARMMQGLTAALIDGAPREVLVASTGVIGRPLPMSKVREGIDRAHAALRPNGFADFARAIMTTDRRPKTAVRHLKLGRQTVTLLGATKGAGMIAPNMATTLTFVTTDAGVPVASLRAWVKAATDSTFNTITVDGDTSTNDTLAVMASGAAGSLSTAHAPAFADALTDLLRDLATQLIVDGEGVHHAVTIAVHGARTHAQARTVARRIATSPLVKTAIAGGDPNWGRILCAVGNAGVPINPARLAVTLDDVPVAAAGMVAPGYREAAAAKVMRRASYTLAVDLGVGTSQAQVLACDLSHEYVTINADYRT